MILFIFHYLVRVLYVLIFFGVVSCIICPIASRFVTKQQTVASCGIPSFLSLYHVYFETRWKCRKIESKQSKKDLTCANDSLQDYPRSSNGYHPQQDMDERKAISDTVNSISFYISRISLHIGYENEASTIPKIILNMKSVDALIQLNSVRGARTSMKVFQKSHDEISKASNTIGCKNKMQKNEESPNSIGLTSALIRLLLIAIFHIVCRIGVVQINNLNVTVQLHTKKDFCNEYISGYKCGTPSPGWISVIKLVSKLLMLNVINGFNTVRSWSELLIIPLRSNSVKMGCTFSHETNSKSERSTHFRGSALKTETKASSSRGMKWTPTSRKVLTRSVDPTNSNSYRGMKLDLLLNDVTIKGKASSGFTTQAVLTVRSSDIILGHAGSDVSQLTSKCSLYAEGVSQAKEKRSPLLQLILEKGVMEASPILLASTHYKCDADTFSSCLPIIVLPSPIQLNFLLQSRIDPKHIRIVSLSQIHLLISNVSENKINFNKKSNSNRKTFSTISTCHPIKSSFEVNLSLNQLAECFYFYWKWIDESNPTPSISTKFDASAPINSGDLDIESLTIPLKVECDLLTLRVFERSHPTTAVLSTSSIDAVFRFGAGIIAFDILTKGKTTLNLHAKHKIHELWWRERAAADFGFRDHLNVNLNKYKIKLDKLIKDENENRDAGLTPLGYMSCWNLSFLTTKKPKYSYTQHCRVNLSEASLLWIPDGLLTWVFFVLHAQRVYKSCRKMVYAKREERLNLVNGGPQSHATITQPSSICPVCGNEIGSRQCHNGLRNEEYNYPSDTRERLKTECTLPSSVSLSPFLCDVSILGKAIDNLDEVEAENRETFDFRIGRLWIIADAFLTDTFSQSDPTLISDSTANFSSVVQADQFIVHYSTASASTLIASSTLIIYKASSPNSQPPPHCPIWVIDFWREFISCILPDSSSRQLTKDGWMFAGTTDSIAIKIPFSNINAISIQTGSLLCSWAPNLLDLIWLIAESTYVDFLSTRRWALLVVEDFVLPSGTASDIFVTLGFIEADSGNDFKITCRSMLLNKDGPNGTIDVVLDDIVVHYGGQESIPDLNTPITQEMEKSTKQRLSWNYSDNVKISSIPPLVHIQQIRIWSGLQKYSPLLGTKKQQQAATMLASVKPNDSEHPSVSPPPIASHEFLLAKCIKIYATDVECNLIPECSRKALLTSCRQVFDSTYCRIGVPDAVYRLIKASKGMSPNTMIPAPLSYLDISINRSSLSFLTGIRYPYSYKLDTTNSLRSSTLMPTQRFSELGVKDVSTTRLNTGFPALKRLDEMKSSLSNYFCDSEFPVQFLTSVNLSNLLKYRSRKDSEIMIPKVRTPFQGTMEKKKRRLHEYFSATQQFSELNEYTKLGGDTESPPSTWRWLQLSSNAEAEQNERLHSPLKVFKDQAPQAKIRIAKDYLSGLSYQRLPINEQISSLAYWGRVLEPLIMITASQFAFHWGYHSGSMIVANQILKDEHKNDTFSSEETQSAELKEFDIEKMRLMLKHQKLPELLENSYRMRYYSYLARTSEIVFSVHEFVGVLSMRKKDVEHAIPIISIQAGDYILERSLFSNRPISVMTSSNDPKSIIKIPVPKHWISQNVVSHHVENPVFIEVTGSIFEIKNFLCNYVSPIIDLWEEKREIEDVPRVASCSRPSASSLILMDNTDSLGEPNSSLSDSKIDLSANSSYSFQCVIDLKGGLQFSWRLALNPSSKILILCPTVDFFIPSISCRYDGTTKPNLLTYSNASWDAGNLSVVKYLRSRCAVVEAQLNLRYGIWCSFRDCWDIKNMMPLSSRYLVSNIGNRASAQTIPSIERPLNGQAARSSRGKRTVLDLSALFLRLHLSIGDSVVDNANNSPNGSSNDPSHPKLPIEVSLDAQVKGADFWNDARLRESLRNVYSYNKANGSQNSTQLLATSSTTYSPAFLSCYYKSFPSNHLPAILLGQFLSPSSKNLPQRPFACLFCQFPFSFDIQPDWVFSLLQLIGFPFCDGPLSAPLYHRFYKSRQHFQSLRNQILKEAKTSQLPLIDRLSSPDMPLDLTYCSPVEASASPKISPASLNFDTFLSVLDGFDLSINAQYEIISFYARVGTARLNIGSLVLHESTRSKEPNYKGGYTDAVTIKPASTPQNAYDTTYDKAHTTTNSSTPESTTALPGLLSPNLNQWFLAWFSRTESIRKLEISWFSLALEPNVSLSDNNDKTPPLCNHALPGDKLQKSLTTLALLSGLSIPRIPPSFPVLVLPVFRIGSIVAELENVADLFVRLDTPRILINILTAPLVLHSMKSWDAIRPIIGEYVGYLRCYRRKISSYTKTVFFEEHPRKIADHFNDDVSIMNESFIDDSIKTNISTNPPRMTTEDVIGIFRFTVQCKDTQANIHWLNLTRQQWNISSGQQKEQRLQRQHRPKPTPPRTKLNRVEKGICSKKISFTTTNNSMEEKVPSELYSEYHKLTNAMLEPPVLSSLNPLLIIGLMNEIPICSFNQLSQSSLAPVIMSNSIDPFFHYDAAAILATEMQLSCLGKLEDPVTSTNTTPCLYDRDMLNNATLITASDNGPFDEIYRRQVEQLLLSTVGPHGLIPLNLKGYTNLLASNIGALADLSIQETNSSIAANHQQQYVQCSLGSCLETIGWDQLRNVSTSFPTEAQVWSWRGMLKPTEACQFVVSTEEVVLSLTLKINYNVFLFISSPKDIVENPQSPFASIKLLTHAQPIAGHTADLHLNGLLWSGVRKEVSSTHSHSDKRAKTARPPGLSDTWKFDARKDRRPLSHEIHPLNRRRANRLSSLEPSLKLPTYLTFESSYSEPSGLLKPLLHTMPLSCLVGLALPLFSDSINVRLEVPVLIINSTSTAAQQLALLTTNVVLNTDFLPILKPRRKRKIFKCLSSDESQFEPLQAAVLITPYAESSVSLHPSESAFPTGSPVASEFMTLSDLLRAKSKDTIAAPHLAINAVAQSKSRFFWKLRQQSKAKDFATIERSMSGSVASSTQSRTINKDTRRTGFVGESPTNSRRSTTKSTHTAIPSSANKPRKPPNHRRIVSPLRRYFHWEECMDRLRRQQKLQEATETETSDLPMNDVFEIATPFHTVTSTKQKEENRLPNNEESIGLLHSMVNALDDDSRQIEEDKGSEDTEEDQSNSLEIGDDLSCHKEIPDFIDSHRPIEIRIDYEFQQLSFSLVKDDCVFCRFSAANLIGSLCSSMAATRESKFEVDLGDIVVESVPPSRHSAANFPFDDAANRQLDMKSCQQETQNMAQGLLSPRLPIGSSRKERNQLILAPSFGEGEDLDAASVIALRGASRLIRLTPSGIPTENNSNEDDSSQIFNVKIYDSLMLRVNPLRVILTQRLIDDIYHFIFPPPSQIQSSKDAIAVVNPKLPVPESSRLSMKNAKSTVITKPQTLAVDQSSSSADNTDCCAHFVYLKFLRVAPVEAQVDYTGSAFNLSAFTRKDRVETLKHAIDKYMWFIGKQATAAVISHKLFKGWVAEKRQRLHLGTRRHVQSTSEELESRQSRSNKPSPPLSGIL